MSNDPDTHLHDEELPEGVVLKEHSYDGIREYDQQLPRWWLVTLYGAIVFAAFYWFMNHQATNNTDLRRIDSELAAIETLRLENSIDVTNDALFVQMSKNAAFVAAGQKTFQTQCASCHGTDLKAGPGFIGVNLMDNEWIHGGKPSEIYHTVDNGVQGTSMITWGPGLGQRRIVEAVAYILSMRDAQ